jgi:hypothetical protein
LPGRCFLRGPNKGKSLGPILPTRLVTVVMDHSPYSPDLTRSDFWLCVPLKQHMACKWFATNADVKQAVTFWLQTPDTSFFCAKIQALMWQWDKCLNVNGEYMYVWCVPFAAHVSCIPSSWNNFLRIRMLGYLILLCSFRYNQQDASFYNILYCCQRSPFRALPPPKTWSVDNHKEYC